ncbi:hypothetical protein KXQ82_11940 [Mucilaginibacter sp. HMF5004]|uniref:HYC_CC_PP family protein n=1 Tax=Mucilaginibacter rivuli TaxID=2857527 RepID=UPI001C5E06C9|nr:hypothetical protein [Mucilaginibacter rivuli]MBW4890436.1 hypothetical protein [Mucilaginibacter rivuli]
MLKRMIIYGMAVFYLAVSTGFTVNFHYCFGQFSSASFGAPQTCAGGKMRINKPCCKTEHVNIAVKDKHVNSTAHTFTAQYAAVMPVVYHIQYNAFATCRDIVKHAPNKAPPNAAANPLYLTFGNYRI